MPQYQQARTVHGCLVPFASTAGHEPVDVRTPASRAAYVNISVQASEMTSGIA